MWQVINKGKNSIWKILDIDYFESPDYCTACTLKAISCIFSFNLLKFIEHIPQKN